MLHPFDLMVAPNGARLMKSDHPALPITQSEVLRTAQACEAAGATALHLHIRDDHGRHSLNAAQYRAALQDLTANTTLRLQVSTEAVGVYDVAAQIACLRDTGAPEASVSIREICRAPEQVANAYATAKAAGTTVQHIVFDAPDLVTLLRYMDEGTIPQTNARAIFVLGRYSENQVSDPADLKPFLKVLNARPITWSVCAFGPTEHTCLLAALNEGGHVRLGFENNRTAADGTPFPDNAASVAAFVHAANAAGFHPTKVLS